MKPIVLTTGMVRATLDGHKTQTRQVVRLPKGKEGKLPDNNQPIILYDGGVKKPRYRKGEILWVKETWQENPCGTGWPYDYRATPEYNSFDVERWRPSTCMPREAARLFLQITNIRAEHLQNITEQDAIAEGFEDKICNGSTTAREEFIKYWDKTHPRNLFRTNPWVWVIEFTVKEMGNEY